jgi:hypothetical protein
LGLLEKKMNLEIFKKYAYLAVSASLVILFFHPVLFSGMTFFFRDLHR